MKRFTGWAVAGAVIAIGGGIWWTRIADRSCCCRNSEPGDVRAVEPLPTPASSPSPPPTNLVETILVLPEIEIAPLPERVGNTPLNGGDQFSSAVRIAAVPRPEATRDERAWMPYAPEDRDLSDARRLAWAKALVRDAQSMVRDDGFDETQEPPLLDRDSKPEQ